MNVATPLAVEIRRVARLAAPAVLSQLGMMMTGVVDVLMLGRLGTEPLAATALGNMWQWAFMSAALGVIMGMDPLISQGHGRGDTALLGVTLQRGVVLALLLSVPVTAAMLFAEPGLRWLGQPEAVARLAGEYNLWRIPGVPFFLLYAALRNYLQGRGLMTPAAWVMWIGNGCNVVLNWALIFGHLGLSPGGLIGGAQASSITLVLLAFLLLTWTAGFRLHQGAWQPWSRAAWDLRGLLRILRLGAPVGVQISLETFAFFVATLMAGWLGEVQVASHQIVLNMAALAFMVPLGISQATAARVGNLIGAGEGERMRQAIRSALLLGVGFMAISALTFALGRHHLPKLYTSEAQLIVLSAGLLPFAALFQLSDGAQAVLGGVLRGMGRPEAGAIVNLVGYFGLALPLSYLLAFHFQLGLRGIWIGLCVGLAVVASLLGLWVRKLARQPLTSLQVSNG